MGGDEIDFKWNKIDMNYVRAVKWMKCPVTEKLECVTLHVLHVKESNQG